MLRWITEETDIDRKHHAIRPVTAKSLSCLGMTTHVLAGPATA